MTLISVHTWYKNIKCTRLVDLEEVRCDAGQLVGFQTEVSMTRAN